MKKINILLGLLRLIADLLLKMYEFTAKSLRMAYTKPFMLKMFDNSPLNVSPNQPLNLNIDLSLRASKI